MSSVRPIITIVILIAVGAFLYTKINEGPAAPVPGTTERPSIESVGGVPPLAATGGTSAATTSAAPLWPTTAAGPTGTAAEPGTADGAPSSSASPPIADVAVANDAAHNIAVPAIPELPPVAVTGADSSPDANQANATGQAVASMPANESVAAQQPALSQGNAAAGQVATSDASTSAATIPPDSQQTVAAASAPAATDQNPLRPPAAAGGAADRYGASIYAQQPVASADAPVEPSFAASWPAIQTALDQGELSRAHKLLSKWYNEPSLTPAETEKVETLLSQLAGTVIYSTEHQLQPARVVKAGETLETIAKEYNVPWQLLAKINGIAAADQLQPGQELKVVRGPFSAIVDLDRSELALEVDGRYAGKFPITVPVGMAVSEGEWLVDQKLVAPGSVTQTSFSAQPSAVDHAIVLRNEPGAGPAVGGPTLAIASNSTPTSPGASPAAIQVSAADAEELADILSIGSRVVIRR